MNDVQIQQGHIKNFHGKELAGMINYSAFTAYKATSVSPHFSVKYVIKGRETYCINGQTHQVHAGQFLVVKPYQEVRAQIDSEASVQGICIYLSPSLFQNSLKQLSHNNPIFPNFPIDSSTLEAKQLFHTLTKRKHNIDSDSSLAVCTDYFAHFIQEQNANLRAIHAGKAATKLHLWQNIERGRHFIHRQLGNKILLQDIANAAHLSPFHFQRTFKAFYKVSPTQYLLRIRMQKALNLLHNQAHSLQSIADQCGFDDLKYFKKTLQNFKNK